MSPKVFCDVFCDLREGNLILGAAVSFFVLFFIGVSEIVFEEFTGGDYLQPAEDPVEELLPEDLNPCNLFNWVR